MNKLISLMLCLLSACSAEQCASCEGVFDQDAGHAVDAGESSDEDAGSDQDAGDDSDAGR